MISVRPLEAVESATVLTLDGLVRACSLSFLKSIPLFAVAAIADSFSKVEHYHKSWL